MSTRKALALSFLDRYSGLILHTVSAMVVARLLTPAELGVYSVTMVLLGFIATFRDMGAGQYLVQQKELTEERIRATWSVQLGLGLALALLVLAAAVPTASFYNEPRMLEIMAVLALNFAITPFLAFPYAWLTREMRFGTIAALRFTGSVVHAGTAIGFAWIGYGPVSLAWANTLTTVSGILAVWILARPNMPWKTSLRMGRSRRPGSWLALSCAIGIPSSVCYTPLVAVGAANETLKIAFVGTVLVLVATLLGAAADLVILSQLLGVAAALSAILWLRLAKRRLEFSVPAPVALLVQEPRGGRRHGCRSLAVITEMGWRSPRSF
ncbi:MAG: oligosaccharide flippase family protein [Candidatus Accumulibacter sp.]|nr:oligosaccharide flippase family protein [Candidatus Accumulibacter propinquus]